MKIVQRLVILAGFVAILATVITYARGYRLDLQKRSVTPTGILAISSSPKAAKVYVNSELKGATDLNLTLPPGQYQVEIKKDGYTSWSKNIKLKGELVLSLDALLFPVNPSLSPLSNLGVVKAVPVDQTEKVILLTENGDETKDGIYLFEAAKKPLSFLPPLKLLALKKDLNGLVDNDFKDTVVYFSPDYKQAIFQFSQISYLFSLEDENKNPFDVTASKETLLDAWQKEKDKNNLAMLLTFPKEIAKIATDSFHIVAFSPDENKFLYWPQKPLTLPTIINPPMIASNQTEEQRTLETNNLYVYDKKEDKNFKIDHLATLENPALWYPDSRHLIFAEGKKISLIEYDDGNKQTVYSGPFEDSFFTSTSDGKIIVLSNLNPETNKLPDLYLVGIR